MLHFSLRKSSGAISNRHKIIVSVSKKVSKKAVERNRVKRRVRACMRTLSKKLAPGSYLIIAKPNSKDVKGKELENELKALCGL